jgi:hypothetical protein
LENASGGHTISDDSRQAWGRGAQCRLLFPSRGIPGEIR